MHVKGRKWALTIDVTQFPQRHKSISGNPKTRLFMTRIRIIRSYDDIWHNSKV